jgi:hypothetical protein
MASPRDPSWGEALDAVMGARLRGVHTAMMGEFRSYSESAQTAEVTLAVQLETADGDFEAVSPLAGVPVLWPGAWEAGDRCLLVFCEESFAKWFDTGSVEPPELLRRHGLHAVCIPLVAPGGAAVDFVALAALVDARLETIRTTWTFPTGVGPSGTAAAGGVPALDSVAATKVKAR